MKTDARMKAILINDARVEYIKVGNKKKEQLI